ncbi:MAG: DEAD/DEAH box helicase [Crocinitomix sp.]|nr:DEAD/DEAH box helicase [Crocinitomix sp.]
MTFKELEIAEPILRAIAKKGYTNPTPIQEQSIPVLLKGKDLLGCAQTGTGKTAAFAIPIIQQLFEDETRNRNHRKIKSLIVTPTRELAIQIQENFKAYSKYTDLRNSVIFGGVKQGKQTAALKQGIDILVATPGRLLDLIGQGYITLKHIEYFVLDEADQMLDMGFIHDIKKIIAQLPHKRQSLFFSATMPKSIVELSGKILGNPYKVTVKPEQATAEKVEQSVYFVAKADKPKLLEYLILEKNPDSTLVFSRTKHGADKIVRKLAKAKITAEAIHGNKSQNQRQRALGNFKNGKTKVLIATDIAARGIDVSELSLVVNYDLPNVPETYVHRIGRTGRAKASGIALSFCDIEERPYLRDIEKLIRQKIDVVRDHLFVDSRDESSFVPPEKPKQNHNRRKKTPGNQGNKNVWRRNKPKNKPKNKPRQS